MIAVDSSALVAILEAEPDAAVDVPSLFKGADFSQTDARGAI